MPKSLVTLCSIAAAAVLFASCDDEPNAKPKALPTGPVAVVQSPLAALNAAPAKLRGSGVCTSYLRERTQLVLKLTRAPKDTALLKRAQALTSIITDACN
jgi:hypothetical protein